MSRVFVIIGVSGSGKTTVGLALAQKLKAPFFDGDDFHPPENVAKMASSVPLDDDDRRYPASNQASRLRTKLYVTLIYLGSAV